MHRQPYPEAVRRDLASDDPKSILAVRVTDSDGRVHPDTADLISDQIFGTNGDTLTMTSQLAACSYGKFNVTNEYPAGVSQLFSAPGVIDVQMNVPLSGTDRFDIGNAARYALEELLGFQLPGPFHNVMFIYESCYTDCGWAAYAYINHWMSCYVDGSHRFVGVQMHEIGHNLNLAHSGGLDGIDEYSDHSCHMGDASPFGNNQGAMCYNPAKSFQLARGGNGWYSENAHDSLVWNPRDGTQWSGTIIGIADYNDNPNARPVVVKIESDGPDDLFVGFNRAAGINRDVVDARDKVTVVEAGNDGLGFAQSYTKAVLSQGEYYHVANWRGSGIELIIHVNQINLEANPGYADVIMWAQVEQTNSPSLTPTHHPTSNPTREGVCGNDMCEFGENAFNCARDCSRNEIVTTFDFNRKSNGNMFMIKALCDLEITSLSINTSLQGVSGLVKVFTREGSYSGFDRSGDGWKIIFSSVVNQLGRGRPTNLGTLLTRVSISSGSRQSFYVLAEDELVYKTGSQEFDTFTSDSCIEIYEGSGIRGEFGSKISPRVWSGIIQYDVKNIITLETTYAYDSGSNGNFFTVKALSDIEIISFCINSMTYGDGAVKVYSRDGFYSGYEHSNVGWELIYDNVSTQLGGRGQPTVLDMVDMLRLSRGEYQSFYVWAERKLVYKRGSIEGTPFVSDESLIIYEGIAVNDPKDSWKTFRRYSPRVWSGSIIYKAAS